MGVCVEVSSKICNNGVHDRRCEDKEDNVISFVWGGSSNTTQELHTWHEGEEES